MKYIISGLDGNVGKLIKKNIPRYIDYTNSVDLKGGEVFLHLASKSNGSYEDIINSNIDYLCEVIDFCRSSNIKKLVFFSAISIYTKDDIYSVSKLLGEKMLRDSGLKVLVLRLPMILTKDRKKGVLNRIVQTLEKNDEIILFNANKKFNNFVSVDDIYGFIKNYSFKKKYEIVDLGSKKEATLLEIVKFMKHHLKSKSNIIIDKRKSEFFNISLKKAKKFNYKPTTSKKILKNWLKERGRYE